ncbi:hypothetical protein FQN54_003710 [Arachnomyces sp. PD_36]|nr:hypothetical protein FQN54_003710 [Arachnomyces sp. PD_36]
MEYKYSTIVDPSTYETEGLCEGIPLRRHVAADLEEVGTFRAQEDWREYVAPMSDYKGGLGPNYSFMTVSVPECLPDRLEIISYANEFAFLHDDVTDVVSREEGDAANDEMMHAFREGATSGNIETTKTGKRMMQAGILKEMMAIDRERAMVSMKSWATFVETASGRQHHTHYSTLAEYIPYRSVDVGHMFWHGLVTFGCGLTIPDEEEAISKELMTPALIAASLTNDLFSYEKEYEDAMKAGHPDVVNAIWVMMGEHGISTEEAKLLCRKLIKEEIKKFVRTVEEVKVRTDISADLRKYVEVMQYSLSGNVVWSLQCPRYHKTARYNDLQNLRAKHGVKTYPAQWPKLEIEAPGHDKASNGVNHTNGTSNGETSQDHQNGFSANGTTHVNGDSNGVNSVPNGKQVNGITANGTHTNGDAVNGTNNNKLNGHANGVHDKIQPSPQAVPIEDMVALAINTELPGLSDKVVLEPYHYLTSLPSKGIRNQAIDAINVWLGVPTKSASIIKDVVQMLHSASLMLDDLQDQSPLRRGRPSTHEIYGPAQTINSATYQYIQAVDKIRDLANPDCLPIFIDEMRHLYVGQSFDLYWVYNVACPTVEEYLTMVDDKTGGLFRMLTRLMATESSTNVDLSVFSRIFGRYYQIRDDYQNLTSADYTKQKGFCEDLDEGKYSLPLIHALQSNPRNMQLRSMLTVRRVCGKSTFEHKQLILTHLKQAGSLDYTLEVLKTLYTELEQEIGRLEKVFGIENPWLTLLLEVLKV